MKAPARKARRLLNVQMLLRDKEASHLLDLQSRLGDIESARGILIGLLGGAGADSGLMLEAVARRLRQLSQEAGRIEMEERRQKEIVGERSAQAEGGQRRADKLEQIERRRDEEQRLYDVIETVPGRRRDS